MDLANYSDFKIDNHPSIMEASRIVISEYCRPFRTVLRKLNEKEYVTHQENMILHGDIWKHGDFYWGHYFTAYTDSEDEKKQILERARADYLERSAKM